MVQENTDMMNKGSTNKMLETPGIIKKLLAVPMKGIQNYLC